VASSEDGNDRAIRAARNQVLFREVNERIKDVNDQFHAYTLVSEWVCECANESCIERLEFAARDYERVRSVGTHFFVAPGDYHVWSDVERVIDRRRAYWIVEKLGSAAEIALARNPRSDGPMTLQT